MSSAETAIMEVHMSTITCKQCGEEIEVTAALQGQIEQQVLAAEHKRHQTELAKALAEAAEAARLEREASQALQRKQLDGEKKRLELEAAAELEIARK